MGEGAATAEVIERTGVSSPAVEPAGPAAPPAPAPAPVVADLLVEEVSIDGMCGVY